jgi:hypothetical protein
MRMVRVSIFIFLAAMLAFIGAAPQRIFAERGRTQARRSASQQQTHHRKSGPKPQQQSPTPLLVADNGFPSFPKQIAGTSSAPLIVTITNSSTTVTVSISSVTSDNPNFTVSGCVTSLAPGANCKLTITYSPSAQTVCGNSQGGDFADISVVSSDPASPLDLTANSAAATPGGLVTDDLRDQALTATDLAQALVGSGVSISNVTYTGAPIAAGTFKGGASIIGFDNGIVLSNGAVSNVIGPNCSSGITWVNNTPGDPDLTAIIGQTTNDAAVLEFDFNPSSPTIRFQYVFASDEYQEFVFDFNDVFAFFVNGTNIALIPQTNTIVSINNVNNGSTDPANVGIPPVNPSFYVNNDFQIPIAAPFNTEMDGMTVVLTATANVRPGDPTNHIKLAIADAIDFVYDSNVFIKGGSLSSTVVSLSPTGLAFGNENVGSTSAAQTVTLTNVGTAALTGVSVATSSAMFTQTNTCAANVAPGGTCTISVKFVPTAAGVVQGSLSITDSAGDSPQPVSLAGTAVSGPFASISPFSLTFGPQAPGTTSPAQTITVTNTGTSALSISTVSAVPTDFKETDNCADFTIQPTNSCTISVTWTANATPPESGSLTITDNGQNGGTQTVGLLGGATNTISISPTSLSFGNQAVNTTSAAQTLTITNTGNTTVLIPSIIAPVGFAETDNCRSLTNGLAPAASCTINVTFTPTSATAFTGNLSITDSAQGSPHTVMLSGTGTAAAPTLVSIAVTPAMATIGVNATQQFTATGTFSDNSTKDVTTQSTWTSSAPATATVGAATGLATGVAAGGPVTITATDGTIMGTAQLTVTSGPTLVSITVTPNPATVSVGGMIQFAATGHFSDNSTKDVTTQSTWTSANTGVATIGATTGKATGVSVSDGSITITATDGNINGTAQLTVSNVPFTLTINPPPGGVFGPVAPGGTLPVGVILTALPGTTGTVTFGCTTSSPTITCSPQPSTVALSPNGPLQVAIVVNTFCKGPVTTGGQVTPLGGFGGGIGLLLLSTMLAGTVWMYRRNPRWAVSFALFVLIALGGVACNSLPRNPNGVTLPGNYQLFITATFNGQTVSAPAVNFVVN